MGHMHNMGVGSDVNHAFAQDYWYIACGVLGLLTAIHAVNQYGNYSRYGNSVAMEHL